jgi:hypothetical protein
MGWTFAGPREVPDGALAAVCEVPRLYRGSMYLFGFGVAEEWQGRPVGWVREGFREMTVNR